ncbi:MAG: rhomboid family intramembrane serine protease [Actinobacteria bacterium]|nr:MAG: rhomboid family intramembrane serine protease [Actinomycetota bacterium]
MSEAELFVVCKNCGSEVSMYVTECPYCGQRVRKRAPKLERGAEPDAVPRRRRRSLPRLRRDEIPGIAPETRPYATIAIVVAALGTTLAWVGGLTISDLGAIVGPIGHDWWRLPAYAFVHTNAGSLFATLVATGLFGMHLERRFGSGAVLAIFLLGATAGGALTVALSVYPAIGANGGALALLTAWVVDDRHELGGRPGRRGDGGDHRSDDLAVQALTTARPGRKSICTRHSCTNGLSIDREPPGRLEPALR